MRLRFEAVPCGLVINLQIDAVGARAIRTAGADGVKQVWYVGYVARMGQQRTAGVGELQITPRTGVLAGSDLCVGGIATLSLPDPGREHQRPCRQLFVYAFGGIRQFEGPDRTLLLEQFDLRMRQQRVQRPRDGKNRYLFGECIFVQNDIMNAALPQRGELRIAEGTFINALESHEYIFKVRLPDRGTVAVHHADAVKRGIVLVE